MLKVIFQKQFKKILLEKTKDGKSYLIPIQIFSEYFKIKREDTTRK